MNPIVAIYYHTALKSLFILGTGTLPTGEIILLFYPYLSKGEALELRGANPGLAQNIINLNFKLIGHL